MSFAYAANVITQTGTDTSLAGLVGLTGVTHTNNEFIDIYTISTTVRLVINGTLTINPEREMLVIRLVPNATNNPVVVSSGATLNIGTTDTQNSYTRYERGIAIFFDNDSTNTAFSFTETGWANLYISSGSTFNWNGGSIYSKGAIAIYGTASFNSQDCLLHGNGGNSTSGGFPQLRMRSSALSIYGLTTIDFVLTLITRPALLQGYNPIHAKSVIDLSSSSTSSSFYTVGNLIAGKGNTRDIGGKSTTYTRLLNTNNGSNIIVESQNPDGVSGQDYLVESREDVTLTYKKQDGTAISGVKVWMSDTNHGSRLANSTIGTAQPNYTNDRTYTGTSDGSGVVAFTGTTSSVLLAVHWHSNDNGSAIYDRIDRRGIQNDSSDQFNFRSINYNYGLSNLTFVLKGNDGFTNDWTLLPDTFLTESTKATVDAYATITNAFQFYDRAKSYLYDNFAGETATLVSRNGSTIDAGSYNVTVDATAGSAFSKSGNTITIKATTFTGSITTTGTVTEANGAKIIGTVTHSGGTYTRTLITLTGLKAGSEVRIYQAGTTTEIDGIESSGTSFSTTTTQSSVDIVVFALGYLPIRTLAADTTANISLPIQQVIDRNYSNP